MNGFLYGVILQWKLDMRSKSLLITCYLVPLLFFAIMGGIFTSINPESKASLIQSMTVMGVSMGAFIGLPPSIVEMYASDIKKVYTANRVPPYIGVISMFLSAFIHLLIMCVIIYIISPIAFGATPLTNPPIYFASLAIFIIVSLSIGSVLGLFIKNQAKLTMISQVVFLPSIMLSGIMFPSNLLPNVLETVGKIFPASWGYKLMLNNGFTFENLLPLLIIFIVTALISIFGLKKLQLS